MKLNKRSKAFISVLSCALVLSTSSAVNAATSGSKSIPYNGSANEHISNTESGHTSNLTAQYYYGASSSNKADMICTYGYNDVLGYKYAVIKNDNITYGGYNIDGETDVSVVQRSITKPTSASTAVIYSGYVKSDRYSSTKLHYMDYFINLTN